MPILILLLFIFSCSPKPSGEKTTINIKLAGQNSVESLEPTSMSDINCVAVMLGYPSSSGNKGNCTRFDDSIFPVATGGGLVSFANTSGATTNVQINDVFTNTNFNFVVLGFNSVTSACPDVNNNFNPKDDPNFSDPFILGEGSGIAASSTTSNVSVTATFSSTNKIKDCDDSIFQFGQLSLSTFGSGKDGDATISSNITDTSTDTSVLGGRYLQPTTRVMAVDASGKELTLNNSINYDTNHFQSDDVILYHVVGATSDSTCDGGNTLKIGKIATARIDHIDLANDKITLRTAITTAPGSLNNTYIAENTTSSTFCRLQIARIPEFNNLTFTASSKLEPVQFNYADGSNNSRGGVIYIKVNGTLTVQAGTTSFDASKLGFNANTSAFIQGQGTHGQGAATTEANNGNGGGSAIDAARGGGGGASAGFDGGDGGNSGISAGVAPTSCTAGTCAVFGGAGASAGDSPGGRGGGIVLIQARNVLVQGTSILNIGINGEDATAGTDEGGGGGGAGDFIFQAINVTKGGSATFQVLGQGGDGADHTGGSSLGGAGGGGGRATISFCSGASPGDISSTMTAGSGIDAGQNGTTGMTTTNVSNSHSFCSE